MRTIARAPEWALGKIPIGDHMWVSIGASGQVQKISIPLGVVDGSASVPSSPGAIGWDGSQHMYVAETGDTLVATVKIASSVVDGTISIGSAPIDFARDATYMYVTAAGSTITRIAIATGVVSGTPISIPGSNGVPNRAAKDSGNYLYVTSNNVDPGISKIIRASASSWGSYSTFNLLQVYPGPLAWDGGSYLYLITANNTITKVSIATGLPVKVINAPSGVTLRYDILWDGVTHIYVTATNAILTLDLITDTFDTIIPMSQYSVQGLARDGSGNIYSANYASSGDIVKISIATRAIVGTLVGFSYPQYLAWDGGSYIWVVNSTGTGSVSLVSTSSFTISTTVVLSPTAYAPTSIAWDGGSYMYIAQPYNNRVYRVEIAGGHSQNVISGFNTDGYSLALAWDGASHMFCTNNNANAVVTIPVSTGTAIDNTIVTGSYPYKFALDGSGNLHVTNQVACTLSRIVVSSQTVDQTTNYPNNWDGVAWDGGSHMYVCNSAMNQVSRVVSSSGGVNKVIPVGTTPKKVAWDGGSYMYVTNSGDGTVSTIAVTTGTIDGAPILVGTNPDEIAWDGANHLYVNNKGSNNVSRILKGSSLRIEGETSLTFWGSVIDGSGHLYYVTNGGTSGLIKRITIATGATDTTITFPGTVPLGGAIAWDGGSYIYVTDNPYNYFPQTLKVYRINISTLAITLFADLGVTTSAYSIRWDHGSYLYLACYDGDVFRVEISSGAVSGPINITIPSGSQSATGLAWDGGSYMYVALQDTQGGGFHHGYIRRIEISSFTLEGTVISVPGSPTDIAWDQGSYIYVANYDGWGAVMQDVVTRIRVSDCTIYDSIPISGHDPAYLAWGGKGLMYLTGQTSPPSVYAIDIATGTIAQTLTGFSGYVTLVTWDGSNRLYVTGGLGLCKVAICSGSVDATINVAGVPTGLAWDGPKR